MNVRVKVQQISSDYNGSRNGDGYKIDEEAE